MTPDNQNTLCAEPRFTTVHSRMQVCCDVCGVVEHYGNMADAIARAKRHHAQGCSDVSVYDIMDKTGKPIKWRSPECHLRNATLTP